MDMRQRIGLILCGCVMPAMLLFTGQELPLRLAEAQQLFDGLQDPLLSAGLIAFYEQQRAEHVEMLLSAVRQSVRDTMKEARLAGKVEVYENCLRELQRFAEDQMRGASQ